MSLDSDIPAPPAVVWAILIDVERWPEWTASVSDVTIASDGPLRVGSEVVIKQPRLPRARWTVTELVDGERFTWTNTSPGITSVASHRVEPAGEGHSHVTLAIEQTGPLGRVLGALYGGLTRRYVSMELAGLAERSTS